MKNLLSIFLILFSSILVAQSTEYIGEYEFYRGNDDNYFLKTHLTLNLDGTFLLLSESYIEERMPGERKEFGKGTWTSEKRLIFLMAEESDIDDKHVLNLNNTKLRYITKSPRDKSNRDIKTSVRMIDTEIFWLKGRTLIKDVKTTQIIKNKECCESMWQAHSYLEGKWKKKNDSKVYQYSFENEKGKFHVYEKTEEGVLKEVIENSTAFKVFKDENKYKIVYGDERLKAILL